MFFKKKKNKHKHKTFGGGGNKNSRQKRKARNFISEEQRMSIVSSVLNKKRLLVYTDSL